MPSSRIRGGIPAITLLAVLLVSVCACGSVPEPAGKPQTAVATGEAGQAQILRLVETDSLRFELVEVSSISVPNCSGQDPIHVRESVSRAASHEVQLGEAIAAENGQPSESGASTGVEGWAPGDVGHALAASLTLELQDQYGFTGGEQFEQTVEFKVEAEPGHHLEYPVAWKEVWTDGYFLVEMPDGSLYEVPYSVLHSLMGELRAPEQLPCE